MSTYAKIAIAWGCINVIAVILWIAVNIYAAWRNKS